RPPGEVHRAHVRLAERLVMRVRTDAHHEVVPHDAADHVAAAHEGDATEHLPLADVRPVAEHLPDPLSERLVVSHRRLAPQRRDPARVRHFEAALAERYRLLADQLEAGADGASAEEA